MSSAAAEQQGAGLVSSDTVFRLIEQHQLFDFVRDKVRVLVNLDQDAAIAVLAKRCDEVRENMPWRPLPACCMLACLHACMVGGWPRELTTWLAGWGWRCRSPWTESSISFATHAALSSGEAAQSHALEPCYGIVL